MENYNASTTIEIDLGGEAPTTIVRRKIALYRDLYEMLCNQVEAGNVNAIPLRRCVMLMYNFYDAKGLLELYNSDITERKIKKALYRAKEFAEYYGDNIHGIKEEGSEVIYALKLELAEDEDLVIRRRKDAEKRINSYETKEKRRIGVSGSTDPRLTQRILGMVLKFPELFRNVSKNEEA